MEALSTMIPIIVLIMLGYWFRRSGYLGQNVISAFQKILLQFAVPCILFRTFMNISLEKDSAVFALAVIFINSLLLSESWFAVKKFKIKYSFIPFFLTCFNFGAIGLPLYIALFGTGTLKLFSLLGVGNEIFSAVIYITLAKPILCHEKADWKMLKNILSPNIIGVLLGVLVNATSFSWFFTSHGIGQGIMNTVSYVEGLTIPFGLLAIGYAMKLGDRKVLKISIALAGARMIIICGLGLILQIVLFQNILVPDQEFYLPYYMFMVLPAPFTSVAVTEQYGSRREYELCSNALVVNCAVSISIYLIAAMLRG